MIAHTLINLASFLAGFFLGFYLTIWLHAVWDAWRKAAAHE